MKQSPSKGDGALNPMTNLTIAEQDDTLAYATLKAVGQDMAWALDRVTDRHPRSQNPP